MLRASSLLLLTLFSSAAFAECGASASEIAELQNLVETDPISTAQSAIENGKLEYLGVAGYSISVPGIDDTDCSIGGAFVHVMPGTTDFRCGPAHTELIRRASLFARQYNAIVKDHLVAKGALRCGK